MDPNHPLYRGIIGGLMFAADYRKEVPGASLDDGINMFSRMLEEASPTNIVYLCDHKRDR